MDVAIGRNVSPAAGETKMDHVGSARVAHQLLRAVGVKVGDMDMVAVEAAVDALATAAAEAV